ncbi:MAG: Hsp20/alpha crystallin family protein [Desulfobia sp.]
MVADTRNKEMQVKEKQEALKPEQTTEGPIFMPAVDIFETDKEITVLADMPGVKSDDLSIDLNNDILTLSGKVKPYDNKEEEPLLNEYETGNYYRQFTLSDIIDQEKIEANLKNGELRLRLPKAEKARPRKIEIKAD